MTPTVPGAGRDRSADCADFLERVAYLLDGELEESDIAEVRAHLRECAPCLHTYDLERTIKALVARSCAESAPAGLRDRVLWRIRAVSVTVTETRRGPAAG